MNERRNGDTVEAYTRAIKPDGSEHAPSPEAVAMMKAMTTPCRRVRCSELVTLKYDDRRGAYIYTHGDFANKILPKTPGQALDLVGEGITWLQTIHPVGSKYEPRPRRRR